jgi:hypothetical protein
VAQVLAEVLVDPQRPPLVRAEAARSIGRLPYERDVDVGLLAHEIARFVQQMTEAFQKAPKETDWKLAYIKVYLAFKPGDEEDAKNGRSLVLQVEQKPGLAPHKKTVQEVYDLVLPIVESVLKDPRDIAAQHDRLKDWLKSNPPKTDRIANSEKPIITDSAGPATSPPATGS